MRLLPCIILLCGCSIAFTNRRAANADSRSECPSYAAPIADTVLSALSLFATIRALRAPDASPPPEGSSSTLQGAIDLAVHQALTSPLERPDRGAAIGTGVVMTTGFALSAATGYTGIRACRQLDD